MDFLKGVKIKNKQLNHVLLDKLNNKLGFLYIIKLISMIKYNLLANKILLLHFLLLENLIKINN